MTPRTKESGIDVEDVLYLFDTPAALARAYIIASEHRDSLIAERDALRERRRPVTPDEWRDELGQFLHAYLLDNEPQVHPVSLATAVWEWLHSQSPPYEAAVAEIERLRETLALVAEAVVNGEWEAARELSDAALERHP